jgi:hypothetical protein
MSLRDSSVDDTFLDLFRQVQKTDLIGYCRLGFANLPGDLFLCQ